MTGRKRLSAPHAQPALPADLVRAIDWLRRNPNGAVGLDKLSHVAGVRPRTLEAHFKQFLGTTPLGWVRNARLSQARKDLLNASNNTTVTGVALSRGFDQLGRFSGAYRQRFGELPSVTLKRQQRASAGLQDDIDDEALRLTWRALPAAFTVAPDSNAYALELLERAQERAPNFGLAQAMAAWCWAQRSAQNFAQRTEDLARANRLVDSARLISPQDGMTLSLAGGALTLAHRIVEADRLIERALALDPYSPAVWIRRGWSSAYLGDTENAIRELRTTLSLAPFEPIRHLAFIGIGCAHFGAGRYERAIAWVKSGVDDFPKSF
jgi:AraC-like DNA-binding protein